MGCLSSATALNSFACAARLATVAGTLARPAHAVQCGCALLQWPTLPSATAQPLRRCNATQGTRRGPHGMEPACTTGTYHADSAEELGSCSRMPEYGSSTRCGRQSRLPLGKLASQPAIHAACRVLASMACACASDRACEPECAVSHSVDSLRRLRLPGESTLSALSGDTGTACHRASERLECAVHAGALGRPPQLAVACLFYCCCAFARCSFSWPWAEFPLNPNYPVHRDQIPPHTPAPAVDPPEISPIWLQPPS